MFFESVYARSHAYVWEKYVSLPPRVYFFFFGREVFTRPLVTMSLFTEGAKTSICPVCPAGPLGPFFGGGGGVVGVPAPVNGSVTYVLRDADTSSALMYSYVSSNQRVRARVQYRQVCPTFAMHDQSKMVLEWIAHYHS